MLGMATSAWTNSAQKDKKTGLSLLLQLCMQAWCERAESPCRGAKAESGRQSSEADPGEVEGMDRQHTGLQGRWPLFSPAWEDRCQATDSKAEIWQGEILPRRGEKGQAFLT